MFPETNLLLFNQRQRDLMRQADQERLARQAHPTRARSYRISLARIWSLFFVY
jgi:hypothetical protein